MSSVSFAELLSRLDADTREAFEERAGIREFDGGFDRDVAEALALADVLLTRPTLLNGLRTWKARAADGGSRLLICVDEAQARTWAGSAGASITEVDPVSAVKALGGLAELRRPA